MIKADIRSNLNLGIRRQIAAANAPLTWRVRSEGAVAASQELMFQPLLRLQYALARAPVCKPFAHKCWLVRTERWPVG